MFWTGTIFPAIKFVGVHFVFVLFCSVTEANPDYNVKGEHAKLASRLIEHLYYKHDSIQKRVFEAQASLAETDEEKKLWAWRDTQKWIADLASLVYGVQKQPISIVLSLKIQNVLCATFFVVEMCRRGTFVTRPARRCPSPTTTPSTTGKKQQKSRHTH